MNIRELLRDTDKLLRGHFTRKEDLTEGKIGVPVSTLVQAGLILGATYGVFMGIYGVTRPENASFWQLVATTAKVPLLFLLTLAVTFPSLYVFSALANTRLEVKDTLRLLLGAVTVNLALLASLGPVTGFFTLSTKSYAFMVILNVLFFAISGFVGLAFLRRALDLVFVPEPPPPAAPAPSPSPPADEGDDESPGEPAVNPVPVAQRAPPPMPVRRPPPPRNVPRLIFTVWTIVYAVVGAQMGWILRPFIGSPWNEFELFRARDSNFFEGLWSSIVNFFS